MADKYMQLVLTPAVQRAQDKYFGKHQVVENAPETDALTPDEIGFIASRDSFYLATVSETGWPYVQHRGGPPWFVKVLGLPAIHHPALHRRRDGKVCGAAESPHRRVGSPTRCTRRPRAWEASMT